MVFSESTSFMQASQWSEETRVSLREETIAFISDLEAHHEPPRAIAEQFAARLAVSRSAQKRLSLEVITTVLAGSLIVLGFVH
jgi:hypothetical protein